MKSRAQQVADRRNRWSRYRNRLGVDFNPQVHRILRIWTADTGCSPDSESNPEDPSLLLPQCYHAHNSPERRNLSPAHGYEPQF
jgi:hypothetical protein